MSFASKYGWRSRRVIEGQPNSAKASVFLFATHSLACASGYHPRNANRIWDATFTLAHASGYHPMIGCHDSSV